MLKGTQDPDGKVIPLSGWAQCNHKSPHEKSESEMGMTLQEAEVAVLQDWEAKGYRPPLEE